MEADSKAAAEEVEAEAAPEPDPVPEPDPNSLPPLEPNTNQGYNRIEGNTVENCKGQVIVFGDDEYHNWLMRQLMSDGAEALLIGSGDRNDRLYRIRMPSGGGVR